MQANNALNAVGQNLERITPTSEGLKAIGRNTCATAKDLCTGDRLGTEFERIGVALASAPLELPAGALRACKSLVADKDVLGASLEMGKGLGNTCYRVAEAITSPARLATAGVKQGTRAAIEIAKAPVTVPLAAYRKGSAWVERATDMMLSADMPTSGGGAKAGPASTPPPPPQGSGFTTAA